MISVRIYCKTAQLRERLLTCQTARDHNGLRVFGPAIALLAAVILEQVVVGQNVDGRCL